jgi:hypothetical protein
LDVLSGWVKIKASEDDVVPSLKIAKRKIAKRKATLMLMIPEYHKIDKTNK